MREREEEEEEEKKKKKIAETRPAPNASRQILSRAWFVGVVSVSCLLESGVTTENSV